MLPFALGGEARALPAGVGVGLVEADVADRLVQVEVAVSGEGPDPPSVFPQLPVERRGPALILDLGPAVREPEEGVAVAAVLDELQVLAVGDQPARQREIIQPGFVDRHLVVPAPAPLEVADLVQAALEGHPLEAGDAAGGRSTRPPGRARAARGRCEPRMCLTSVTSSSWCCCSCWMPVTTRKLEALEVGVRGGADQLLDARVDRLAETEDLLVGRPGHEPAVVAADARPQRLVVGVEDELQPGVAPRV